MKDAFTTGALRFARRTLDRVLPAGSSVNYTGPHGCLRAGASFITWNQIEGDYLEFGVASGDSFVAAWDAITATRRDHLAQGYDSPAYRIWRDTPTRFFAFDSFEGLPEGAAERHVDYAAGGYAAKQSQFRSTLAAKGVDMALVEIVPGFYDTSLQDDVKRKHRLERAAMVMVDCDLYESTVPVLRFITDLVHQGTIIVFHDWFRFRGNPRQGEQRACREWLEQNPHIELIEFWREAPQAVSFLVNLR